MADSNASTDGAGRKALKDFMAGNISGFCGKLVEYPFDTVKVLQQTAPKVLDLFVPFN